MNCSNNYFCISKDRKRRPDDFMRLARRVRDGRVAAELSGDDLTVETLLNTASLEPISRQEET